MESGEDVRKLLWVQEFTVELRKGQGRWKAAHRAFYLGIKILKYYY
jgi:hypothetical protein